jgi:hypothetical protein
MKTLILLAPILASCQSLTYQNGPIRVTHWEFAMSQSIGHLEVTAPDGVKASVDSLSNDQTKAIGVAVESAVKAAVASVKP